MGILFQSDKDSSSSVKDETYMSDDLTTEEQAEGQCPLLMNNNRALESEFRKGY